MKRTLLLTSISIISCAAANAGTAQFSPIEGVYGAGAGAEAIPEAVSNQGKVVVGDYLWTPTDGAQALSSQALVDISGAGNRLLDAGQGMYVDGVYQDLLDFEGRALQPTAMSDDGSVVVGNYMNYGTNYYNEEHAHQVIWTETKGFLTVGKFAMSGISPNGKYAVGAVNDTSAVLINVEDESVSIHTNKALGCYSGCGRMGLSSVSDNGTAVGYFSFENAPYYRQEAAYWEGATPVRVGGLNAANSSGRFHAVSRDGAVMVGYAATDDEDASLRGSDLEAVVWDRVEGLRSLEAVLETEYGVELGGWRLTQATAISNDGFTIAGYGINPQGNFAPWVVTMSTECNAVTW